MLVYAVGSVCALPMSCTRTFVYSKEKLPDICVNERIVYNRREIITIRRTYRNFIDSSLYGILKDNGLFHYRGSRAGARHRNFFLTAFRAHQKNNWQWNSDEPEVISRIEVIHDQRLRDHHYHKIRPARPRYLKLVHTEEGSINVPSTMNDGGVEHPSLYLLNPTGLAKPHAIDQLRIDMSTCKPVIIVIVESWFKAHHLDSGFIISDYSLFRLDRKKRRGGGVAIYCHNNTDAKPYSPKVQGNSSFEILWVQMVFHSQLYIIGGLYHPPKPIYDTKELLSYLTNVLEEVYVF